MVEANPIIEQPTGEPYLDDDGIQLYDAQGQPKYRPPKFKLVPYIDEEGNYLFGADGKPACKKVMLEVQQNMVEVIPTIEQPKGEPYLDEDGNHLCDAQGQPQYRKPKIRHEPYLDDEGQLLYR